MNCQKHEVRHPRSLFPEAEARVYRSSLAGTQHVCSRSPEAVKHRKQKQPTRAVRREAEAEVSQQQTCSSSSEQQSEYAVYLSRFLAFFLFVFLQNVLEFLLNVIGFLFFLIFHFFAFFDFFCIFFEASQKSRKRKQKQNAEAERHQAEAEA